MIKKFLRIISDPKQEDQHFLITWYWLLFLFILGLYLWGYFFNFGNIPFDFHDWAEINAPRIAFLKDAIEKMELPLHMPDGSALRNVTDRYMALPDIILSPDVILLRWLNVGNFFVAHIWILYTLGFAGLLFLKKRFSLSLLSFTWLFLLYNFNGHNLTHFSIGHCTWGGNLLFSWFIYLVFQLLDGRRDWNWIASMAFLMFFTFLQGSFHQFVWIVLFLGFLAISNWSTFWTIIKAGVFGCLLSMVRIIPPAIQMGSFDDDFLGGYRTPIQLLKAFITIITPVDSWNQKVTGAIMGWWEFDVYIGIFGFSFLVLFMIYWFWQRRKDFGFPNLLVPIAVLSIFSIRNCYEFFRNLPIPLFSGERVSSRFIIIPLVFTFVLACACFQDFLRKRNYHPAITLLSLVALGAMFSQMLKHLEIWKVTNSYPAFDYTWTDLSIKVVSNHTDPAYTNGLLIGLIITLLSGIILLVITVQSNRKTTH